MPVPDRPRQCRAGAAVPAREDHPSGQPVMLRRPGLGPSRGALFDRRRAV